MIYLHDQETQLNRRNLCLPNLTRNDISDSDNHDDEEVKVVSFHREADEQTTTKKFKLKKKIKSVLVESLRHSSISRGSKCSQSQKDIYKRHLADVKHDELHSRFLKDDVFSMLFICNNKSHVTVFCIVTITFQFLIIFQVINNALTKGEDNFFSMPPDIDFEVRLSQAFAIFLMAASQEDFYDAIAFLLDGYSPKIVKMAPHATRSKFFIVGFLKLFEGALCIFTTFTLVVQSNEVLGLFLNFAALEFLTDIDNFFFHLARYYLITDELGILADQVLKLKIPIPIKYPGIYDEVSSYRLINYFFVTVFCVTCWLVCTLQQFEGRFSCQSLQVQFGDISFPAMGTYSGAYDRIRKLGLPSFRVNQRSVYKRRNSEDAMFMYCDSQKAWIFAPNINGGSYLDIEDPCNNYAAKSQETKSFDLIETSKNKWLTWNLATEDVGDFDFFFLQCNDCNSCSGVGTCSDNACTCNPGSYGLSCEFKSDLLCHTLVESEKTKPFFKNENAQFILAAETDTPISSHNRPIYYREVKDGTAFEIILFNGRRWALTRTNYTVDMEKFKLFEKVVKSYDIMNLEYAPTYLSESINIGSALDRGSPLYLSWFDTTIYVDLYKVDSSSSVKARLLCPLCEKETITCFNKGVCVRSEASNSTSYCKCVQGFYGSLCEARIKDSV